MAADECLPSPCYFCGRGHHVHRVGYQLGGDRPFGRRGRPKAQPVLGTPVAVCGDCDPYLQQNDLHNPVMLERAARQWDHDTGYLEPFVPAYHRLSLRAIDWFAREVLREPAESPFALGRPLVIWEEIGSGTVWSDGRRSLIGQTLLDDWRRGGSGDGR
jgi:hypothetical protein